MGLELNGMSAKLVGIDGLDLSVTQGQIKFNKVAAGTSVTPIPDRLDWSTFSETANSLVLPAFSDLTSDVGLEVRGQMELGIQDFVYVSGGFAMRIGQTGYVR